MLEQTPVQRAGGLRVLRIVTFVNSLGVIALAGLLIFAFHTIQGSRVEAARFQCESLNQRNRAAISKLHELHFSKQGTRATTSLIDTLAPRRADCDRYARDLIAGR